MPLLLDAVSRLIPLAASVSSILLALSPIPSVLEILSKRSTGSLAFAPFISMLLNNVAMFSYGFELGDRIMISVATLDGLLAVWYVSVYYTYSHERVQLQRTLLILQLALMAGLALIASAAPQDATFWLGVLSNIAAVVMFAAPLVKVREVMRTRSVAGIPRGVSVMSFVCSSLWTVYGLQVGNVLLTAPNALGAVLAAAQLSLFVLYPATPPSHHADAGSPAPGGREHQL